jgi:sterol desaturase/sphingolipid hydroxylase (fatty acid hydroxylase superfamily)
VNVTGVVLALLTLAVVGVIGYRVGYLRGQAELLERGRLSAAEWNALRMMSVLPRWRRVAGWVAYGFSGLLLCLFLALAYRYAQGWVWSYLMGVWSLWFAIFLGGIWLAEWCWKPRAAERHKDGASTEDSV